MLHAQSEGSCSIRRSRSFVVHTFQLRKTFPKSILSIATSVDVWTVFCWSILSECFSTELTFCCKPLHLMKPRIQKSEWEGEKPQIANTFHILPHLIFSLLISVPLICVLSSKVRFFRNQFAMTIFFWPRQWVWGVWLHGYLFFHFFLFFAPLFCSLYTFSLPSAFNLLCVLYPLPHFSRFCSSTFPLSINLSSNLSILQSSGNLLICSVEIGRRLPLKDGSMRSMRNYRTS